MASKQPRYPCLAQLSTRGTFYDVGYNVGVSFSRQLQCSVAESENIQNKLLPFYDSVFGRQYFEESLKVTKECFPMYLRELEGMSDGAGIPFEHLFMINISKEVYNVLLDPSYPEKERLQLQEGTRGGQTIESRDNFGCSDVFINKPDLKVIIHNEDCDPLFKPYGFLLSADIEDNGFVEQFTAFTYPGYLPGCAFGFNAHGLTFSIDGLYPDRVSRNSPSRIFLNRALLNATDILDAHYILENKPFGTAFAFCANISLPGGAMYSLEVGPNRPRSFVHVHQIQEQRDASEPCHYYHFNSFKHLPLQEMGPVLCSSARQKRSDELPPPRTLEDALMVMSDAGNNTFPIFRTPGPTDTSETISTTVFDVLARKVHIYQGKPAAVNAKPVVTLPMYM